MHERPRQPRISPPLHPGYACRGEQLLKVPSEAPERENRRIAIRRTTDLVQAEGEGAMTSSPIGTLPTSALAAWLRVGQMGRHETIHYVLHHLVFDVLAVLPPGL